MRSELNKEELEQISRATLRKCRDIGLKHARANQPSIKKTMADLSCVKEEGRGRGLVIAAGPSLHRHGQLKLLKDKGFQWSIIACDGALYACLRNGIVPHYVLSVDPHPTRIIRNFGDPELTTSGADDYFRRSDLDPAMHSKEVERNRELVELVDRHGLQIKAILSTSVAPEITGRCIKAGMDIYWWNPIYDDYDAPDSFTRELFRMNKVPCMATGGNVGTSCWVFGVTTLGLKEVGLLGMDLSYPPGTPLLNTQYYYEMKELYGNNVENGYVKVRNPYLDQEWFADPAYFWYRNSFLELVKCVDNVRTCNCTQGGILFGEGIDFISFEDFLRQEK